MTGTSPIRFDLRSLPAAEQIAFWQDVSSAYRVGGAGPAPLDVAVTIWPFPELVVNRFSARAHRIVRELRAGGGGRFVKLRLYRRGGGRVTYDGGRARLGVGAVALIDHARGWSADYADHAQCSIFIPHGLLGYRPSEHPVVTLFPETTPSGALLRWAMEGVIDGLSTGADRAGEAAALRLCSLLEAILAGGAGASRAPDIEATRAAAMQGFVRSRMSGAPPRAEEIATAFGVSRATVFRAFAEAGGVRSYLMRCRLDAAHDVLTRTRPERGRVVRLARDLGFASTAHFSDAFLDRFGARPSAGAGAVAIRPAEAEARAPTIAAQTLERARFLAADAYGRMTG